MIKEIKKNRNIFNLYTIIKEAEVNTQDVMFFDNIVNGIIYRSNIEHGTYRNKSIYLIMTDGYLNIHGDFLVEMTKKFCLSYDTIINLISQWIGNNRIILIDGKYYNTEQYV